MTNTNLQQNDRTLTSDALAIWQAGVEAVRADRVVEQQTHWDGRWLEIGESRWDLRGIERLIIVGAGKASAGMWTGLRQAFARSNHATPPMIGWINVPEGAGASDGATSNSVRVFEARPKARNEPTEKVVHGTEKILELVRLAGPKDCVIALISGGGSALLCSPIPCLAFNDKIELTRSLSAAGANIEELNAVRRCLSNVKGGGLARACRAQFLITCILSDVLGDPLEYIASGPTILEPAPDPKRALQVLDRLLPGKYSNIRSLLNKPLHLSAPSARRGDNTSASVLANNATAVDMAGQKAVELGYRYWMKSERKSEGEVSTLAGQTFKQLVFTLESHDIDCLIHGGEPSVLLPPQDERGRGGRNQQLALGVLDWFHREQGGWPSGLKSDHSKGRELVFVSGGTDGEDGPTDAAGAYVDKHVYHRMLSLELDPQVFLRRCDAYAFFEQTGGLIVTGPTHTNVCDLRIALVR